MCGRFTLTVNPADLQDTFGDFIFPTKFAPRFNIAPTSEVLIVRPGREDERVPARVRWGLLPVAQWSPRARPWRCRAALRLPTP